MRHKLMYEILKYLFILLFFCQILLLNFKEPSFLMHQSQEFKNIILCAFQNDAVRTGQININKMLNLAMPIHFHYIRYFLVTRTGLQNVCKYLSMISAFQHANLIRGSYGPGKS